MPPRRMATSIFFGAGVDGVFDQLLHHAGRTLNDFTRRDLAGDLFREKSDAGHGGEVKVKSESGK